MPKNKPGSPAAVKVAIPISFFYAHNMVNMYSSVRHKTSLEEVTAVGAAMRLSTQWHRQLRLPSRCLTCLQCYGAMHLV